MPIFTPKERRAHYTAVASGAKPVKANSQFSEEVQRAYARGQRDALNEGSIAFVLGKHSNLSEAEKAKIRADRKARAAEYKAKRAATPAQGKRK